MANNRLSRSPAAADPPSAPLSDEAALLRVPESKRIRSLGIIMDGNGRWAKAHHLPRTAGHSAGAKNIRSVLSILREFDVRTVTLYAFSTENWKRPQKEVDAIMDLAIRYIDSIVIPKIQEDPDFSVRFLGDKSRLPEKVREKCEEAEAMAKDRAFVCNIALNYGGRGEILHAFHAAIADGVQTLTEETFSRYLYTAGQPDPDLIVRTAGEYRLSNFLLWQSAYAELYVSQTLWPDFGREDIVAAFSDFYRRKRRFGGLDEDAEAAEPLTQ